MKQLGRYAVTAAILGLFSYAVFVHYDDGIAEVLKAMALTAVGYWLGSSNGSYNKDERKTSQEVPISS